MVTLNKIYTRTGDEGTTRLATGEAVSKQDLRVCAYGSVDELNANLGLCRLHTPPGSSVDQALSRIQNDLFDLGADLATPVQDPPPSWTPLRIIATQVVWLEDAIDAVNAHLEPLNSFVLPSGTPLAAHLHVSRTICRRAEREVVALIDAANSMINPEALKYLNRLSDYLFVLSRHANDDGRADILWVPGASRTSKD
ncbi:MAG: cob(I)yrinic acid a,c-diamide adenosyltransferase [Asticcacaulis sp.]